MGIVVAAAARNQIVRILLLAGVFLDAEAALRSGPHNAASNLPSSIASSSIDGVSAERHSHWLPAASTLGSRASAAINKQMESFASLFSKRSRTSKKQLRTRRKDTHAVPAAKPPSRAGKHFLSSTVKVDGLSLLQEEAHVTPSPKEALSETGDMTVSEVETEVNDDEEDEDGAARMPFAMVAAVLIVGGLAAGKLLSMLHGESIRSRKGKGQKEDKTSLNGLQTSKFLATEEPKEMMQAAAERLFNIAEGDGEEQEGEEEEELEVEPQGSFCGDERVLLQKVRKMPVHTGDDIRPPRKTYDCVFAQPQEDIACCRLQGRVRKASSSATLLAPVSGQECVLFSTSAVELRMDGVHAPPLAFYAVNLDFELELPGNDGNTVVHVCGTDVALYGLVGGRHRRRTKLQEASEALQSFVRTHRGAPASPSHTDGSMVLDFTESCLPVGALVTCTGKLSRSRMGRLELLPCDQTHFNPSDQGIHHQERVFISDHPSLLLTRPSST